MQRFDHAGAGTLGGVVVDDSVHAARPEGRQHAPVQFAPVLVGQPQIVIGEDDHHGIQRGVVRERNLVHGGVDPHHVLEAGFAQQCGQRLGAETVEEGVVSRVDGAFGTDHRRKDSRVVAAARQQVGHAGTCADTEEFQHLGRHPPGIPGPVFVGARGGSERFVDTHLRLGYDTRKTG